VQLGLSIEALGTNMGGIGRYTWELAQRVPLDGHIDTVKFWRQGRWFADPAPFVRGETIRRSALPRWAVKMDARRAMRNRLFHGTNYFLPEGAEGGIVTLFDLSVLLFPEFHPIERVRFFEVNLTASLNRAGAIITCSNTVRDEAIAHLGLLPERITAIPLGASAEFRPRSLADLAPVLAHYGLVAGGYGLSVATLDPRKRFIELLAAWRRLGMEIRRRWPLVVAGGDGWLSDDIRSQLDRAVAAGWVRRVGFVPDAHLPALYAGSALFVYPSTYEGFGLPPIEAMASGVPVVVANASCLPEITRGAAMMVDPCDITAFSESLERALTDEAWRRDALIRGLEVAGGYSWEACVDQTVSVYRSLSRQD
jgi:glycosyltransferase involved in cell wall biosynthesis